MTSHVYLNTLRLERCYYLHFTRHSELLRGSLILRMRLVRHNALIVMLTYL